MKMKNLLTIWFVLLFALSGSLYAKEHTNTSFYVAYDSTDATQFALVMPAVNKVYTHQAGHILPADLKQIDFQFKSPPTYDNGKLCFSALKSDVSGDDGASKMAGKCYDVNFFYTQKELAPNGSMAFILTYIPTDTVYEGLAGKKESFKVVRVGNTVTNENSITGDDYTVYRFDVRAAKAILGEEPGIASLSGSVGDVVNPITAVLELDVDGDGLYGGKGDRTLSDASNNGSFSFESIAVVQGQALNGQLIVTADGYAPFQTLVSLQDGDSIAVDASAALNKTALKEVVSLAGMSKSARMNSVVEFGIRKNGTKVESYSRLISLSQFRAEASADDNTLFDDGMVSKYSFGTASFADDVKTVEATMQAFDSTKADDIKNFPGSFRGYGEGGAAKGAGDEVGLESAAFDLLVMKDQNGQNIELVADKLSSNVDLSSCTNRWTRRVTSAQKTVINGWGDYDDADPGYQVPIWSNDNSENAWKFVGIANFDADNSKFEMCIPDDWGSGYLNCDSPIAFTQPTLICVNVTDQNSEPLSNIYINGRTASGQYGSSRTGDTGHTSMEITDTDMSHWSFTYKGAITGWTNVTVVNVPVEVNSDSCSYELNITDVVNPYSAEIRVTALNSHGELVGPYQYVGLQHSGYGVHNYSRSAYTDANSQVTFDVEPNVEYIASYIAGRSTVNVNGVKGTDVNETADTGTYADVNVSNKNTAPNGYIYASPRVLNINLTESTRVIISASDRNSDALTMTALTVDGTAVSLADTYTSSSDGSLYMYGDLNISAMTKGTHTIAASISDGALSKNISSTFIIEGNRVPVIASPLIAADTSISPAITYNIDESGSGIKPNTYLFNANVYDPDGDTVTVIMELNGTIITAAQTLAEGNYEINVTAQDGGTPVSKVFNFNVGNQKPVIEQAGVSPSQVNLHVNSRMMVYAFVVDPDGDGIGSVVATDMNTSTTYTMNTTDGHYFTVDMNASEIGEVDARRFEIVAQDAAATPVSSDPDVVTVSIRNENEAPNFYIPMHDLTIHEGEAAVFSVTGEDPEGSRVSFLWTIDGTPFLGAVPGTMAGEEVTTFTGLKEGEHIVTCTLGDSDPLDPKTTTGRATITVENQAPVFDREPESQTVEIGTDAVFECQATDTDTPVSYAWYIGGAVKAGETGTTLTLNSSTEVAYTVSCSATDRFGKRANSRVADLTVYDPSLTHPLTVNTHIPNITVAVHDENNNLQLLNSKVTDEHGTAIINVPGTLVTFSISFDPSVAVAESKVWDEMHDDIIRDASNNCQWNNSDLNLTRCKNADWCVLSTADTIPVWVVNAAKIKDSNDTNVTGESMDTNNDQLVSSSELYASVLLRKDKNDDGVISWSEIGNRGYTSMIFRDVPIREYTFDLESGDNYHGEYYGNNFCASDSLTLDINVTNISGYINNLQVSGSGWGSAYESNSSKNSFGTKVNIYQVDSDGKYDFTVKMKGDAGEFYELLLDQTAGTMVDGKTYDAVSLTPPTMKDANVTDDIGNFTLRIAPQYNSIDIMYPQWINQEGNTTQFRMLNDDRLTYLIWASKYERRGEGNINYGQRNYYGDGKLYSSYRASDYPMIDVNIDLNATLGRITYSGTEKGKIDFSRTTIFGSSYGENCNYDCGLFDISITSFGNPTETLTLSDLNMSKIYPENIAKGLTVAMKASTSFDHSVLAYEFKNKTGVEVIDSILAAQGDFYYAFQAEASRYVGFYMYRNLTRSSKISGHVTVKGYKLVNPFSIKMNLHK